MPKQQMVERFAHEKPLQQPMLDTDRVRKCPARERFPGIYFCKASVAVSQCKQDGLLYQELGKPEVYRCNEVCLTEAEIRGKVSG